MPTIGSGGRDRARFAACEPASARGDPRVPSPPTLGKTRDFPSHDTHLLVEHGLGLTTETALLAVITPLTCDGGIKKSQSRSSRRSPRGRGGVPAPVGAYYILGDERLTLRVQRGLARLVLRHLVGRMLLALLAEALLSLGNVHLRRVGEGDGRQRRSRGENGATRGHLAKALKRQWKTPRSSPKRDARGRCDGRDAPETRQHGGIAHEQVTHHLYRSPSLWRHVAARL